MGKQIFKVTMGKSTLMIEVKGHLLTVSAKIKVKKEEFVNTLEDVKMQEKNPPWQSLECSSWLYNTPVKDLKSSGVL